MIDKFMAGIEPRAGTNFVLGPLSDRVLTRCGLVVDGQCMNGKDMGHLASENIIDL